MDPSACVRDRQTSRQAEFGGAADGVERRLGASGSTTATAGGEKRAPAKSSRASRNGVAPRERGSYGGDRRVGRASSAPSRAHNNSLSFTSWNSEAFGRSV
eukprot:28745-Pelagococcus_subviridis.AAC.2